MRTVFIIDVGWDVTFEQLLWLVGLVLLMPCIVLLADAISKRVWR